MLSFINITVIIIFIYAANDGIIRFFMLFTAFLGILLYKISLGKLQKLLAAVLSEAISAITTFIIKQIRKLTYPLKAGRKSRRVMRYIKRKVTAAAGR